jgi:protein phosphatase PTC7
MIPHPDKVAKGGEDAYYTHPKIIAVADGVGGWASYGVDPGKYSKQYCKNVGLLFEQNPTKYLQDP